MPTYRVEIGPKHIKEAEVAAIARVYTTSNPLIFADVVEKGLILRTQAGSIGWALKWNGNTRSLGKLEDVSTAKAARALAKKARTLLKDGTDPKYFLTGKVAGKSDEKAEEAARQRAALKSGQWTWEKLVSEYTDEYLAKPRLTRGRLKPPSKDSAHNAKASLTAVEADDLKGKLLSELSAGDLEDVRDKCADAGRKTASRAFVANAKAALSFARKKHARKSGLAGSPRWWLEVEILDSTAVAPRTRMPSLDDIARTLYIAEKHRVLSGRKNSRGTSETVLCGLWWLALTAQRSGAGLALERAHILAWPDGPKGWRIVLWSEATMKSRRFHALPIPPRLSLLIERATTLSAVDSKFVFPATAKRVGAADSHLNKSSPKNLLARLRGQPLKLRREKEEIQDNLPNLLADVAYFSMHDLRRTFATVCGDMAVRGDAISAVLDHAGLETGQRMMRSAEITRLAYDYSQRLELKRIAIEAWTDALFLACDKVWKANVSVWPVGGRRPPPPRSSDQKPERKKVSFSETRPWYAIMETREAEKKALSLDLVGVIEPGDYDWEDAPKEN
ncbi:integrase arm-type DNA-binding domain-containing protein [Phyllobacterium sp. SB3]|uniref:integrase arm-type DNA-binding domain-containing protein n=1 Tax=Phyllobacterium sp. SB3 TaxID=3156073 RepID=UPI0032AEDCCA